MTYTADMIFTNAEAKRSGLDEAFWLRAQAAFDALIDAEDDRFDAIQTEKTVRLSHCGRRLDVLIRGQPNPHEENVFRLTAFDADESAPVPDISRIYYWHGSEDHHRKPVGEAVIPDAGNRW